MRPSQLWMIFSTLLTTGKAIQMCGFRDYKACEQFSDDKEQVYDCLKRLMPHYITCNASDTLCTSTRFTFLDNFMFNQQGCVSEENACNLTVTYQMRFELTALTNRRIDNGTVRCTSCPESGCNSLGELGYGMGCYVVDKIKCLNDFNYLIQNQTIGMAQYQTFNCLINSHPDMCLKGASGEDFCQSKTFTFDNEEVLVLKKCVIRRDECETDNEKVEMQNYIKKNVTDIRCEYCDTDFCNNQTVFLKPAFQCYYSDYSNCESLKNTDGHVERHQNESYDCLKKNKPIQRHCLEGCATSLFTVEDNVTLAMQTCYHPRTSCQHDDGAKLGDFIGRKIIKFACRNCTESLCNNETTIIPIVPKSLTCYHSILERCGDIANVITDFDDILRCLTEKMNKNISTTTCEVGLKCTTIVFTLGRNGKAIEYATCGSGPKSACEKEAHEMKFERFIGQRIERIECKYCATDYCNTVLVPLEGARSVNSKDEIQCYVHDYDHCLYNHKSEKGPLWNDQQKHVQEKIFQCLQSASSSIKKCHVCLTITYNFRNNKEQLILKHCGGNAKNFKDTIRGSKSCDLKKNQNWFWEYTRKHLVSLKCNPCDTDLCNGDKKAMKKKKVTVPSNQARKIVPNIGVFVFTTIFFFN